MKNEEKQEVTDRSWIFPLICLSLLILLAMVPIGRSSPEEKIVRAQAKAEVLAYQVAQLYKESTSHSEEIPTSGRAPASADKSQGRPVAPAEGLMGQDPWGQPYHYRIHTRENGKLSVEMRSAGPGVDDPSDESDDIVVHLSF